MHHGATIRSKFLPSVLKCSLTIHSSKTKQFLFTATPHNGQRVTNLPLPQTILNRNRIKHSLFKRFHKDGC